MAHILLAGSPMAKTPNAIASVAARRRQWGLSADEAETVIAAHFAHGIAEARIDTGCFVVSWRPAEPESDGEIGSGAVAADSFESFEGAIRALGRRRPDLVRESLDAPDGLLLVLRGGATSADRAAPGEPPRPAGARVLAAAGAEQTGGEPISGPAVGALACSWSRR
jgi:hypothetical protein